ncbi:hypothetical protein WA026_013917 [Henosepilachna vigintioctopunctata]|uniref:SWIM-type domain-containing protein n=1 Tax=Henosepilachna vigintioctopunctata TaxID=420089 RepID=A0AAW1U8E3_9CUCU
MYFLEVYKDNPGMSEYVHRKGYNMMINEYLVALESCTQKNLYFYKGKVKSENTKALLYFISIAFKLDGQIVQSKCGCIAAKERKGVCKHIACVCYAILKFKEYSVWQMKKTPIKNKHKSHKLENINIHSSSKIAENFTFEIDKYYTTKQERNMCFDPRPDNTSSSQQWNDHKKLIS